MQRGLARCICSGSLEPGVVDCYRFVDDCGRERLVHHVPAAVCTRCGDVVVGPETISKIERAVRRAPCPPRYVDLAAD